MILARRELKKLLSGGELTIKPFEERNLGPADLDLRISALHARLTDCERLLDPQEGLQARALQRGYIEVRENEEYVIQPGEHLLVQSLEYLQIPTSAAVFVGLRSTFSRLGLSCPPTWIDPGFKGRVTLHLIGGSFPIKLHAGMALFKLVFMRVSPEAEPYAGKYQGQRESMLPKADP